MPESLGQRFARALAAKDEAALRELLAADVDFKGMTPGRLWEGSSPDEVLDAVFGHWFGAADHIDELLHATDSEPVVDLAAFSYRVHVTNDDGRHVVEQQGYYRASDERIGYLRLMCSGYRPVS